MSAVGAAKDLAPFFHSVADDAAAAMGADRGQFLDGALKGVENMRGASDQHFERLVVSIATGFTRGHGFIPFRLKFRVPIASAKHSRHLYPSPLQQADPGHKPDVLGADGSNAAFSGQRASAPTPAPALRRLISLCEFERPGLPEKRCRPDAFAGSAPATGESASPPSSGLLR